MWVIVRPERTQYEKHYAGRLTQYYNGTTKFMGFLPTGAAAGEPADVAQRKGLVTLFWSIRESEMVECRRQGLAAWKDDVLRLHPSAAPLLAEIQDFDQLLLARYQDTRMYPYHEDNVVYIGDACHSMNPALGMCLSMTAVGYPFVCDGSAHGMCCWRCWVRGGGRQRLQFGPDGRPAAVALRGATRPRPERGAGPVQSATQAPRSVLPVGLALHQSALPIFVPGRTLAPRLPDGTDGGLGMDGCARQVADDGKSRPEYWCRWGWWRRR